LISVAEAHGEENYAPTGKLEAGLESSFYRNIQSYNSFLALVY